ncbi:YebC/PmpR family DNA-binding transcriptional regulator [bacterium]|nr:YebC/PmpR family DNA-binding transcriptional regulator [bacterium]MBU1600124.1 YebC/PmpR family DNA-binding transcriptional regulator [bacterium]
MSGHSKWAGIKHKKGALDAIKGKVFSRLSKEITICARMGGGDPEGNSSLRLAMAKARESNMPADNIKRAIARGTGEGGGEGIIESVIYEGYGTGGVAVLVEALTDNKKRAASEIRHIFSRHGGSMGEAGCVSWLFSKKGVLTVDKNLISEDKLFDLTVSSGAEDIKIEDDEYTITTNPGNFENVREAIKSAGFKINHAEIEMLPQNYIKIGEKEAKQVLKLVEMLEENDDAQAVYSNMDIPDELL